MLVPSELNFFLILGASVVGSVHCSMMCVPIAATLGGRTINSDGRNNLISKFLQLFGGQSLAAYHFGRLSAYLALCAMVFTLGHRFDATGVVRLALSFVFILFFTFSLLREQHNSGCCEKKTKHEGTNGYWLGVTSAGMPCAWLWAMLFLMTKEKHLMVSLLYVIVFWIGTLPVFSVLKLKYEVIRRLPYLKNRSSRLIVVYVMVMFSVFLHLNSFSQNGLTLPFCNPKAAHSKNSM